MSKNQNSSFVAGLNLPAYDEDAATLLELARADGYDFVATSLPECSNEDDKNDEEYDDGIVDVDRSPRTDVTALESKWWSTSVVGFVPDTLDQGDTNTITRRIESRYQDMLEWAGHMNLPAIILPSPPHHQSKDSSTTSSLPPKDSAPYARLVTSLALTASTSNVQLWIRVPFTEEGLSSFALLQRRAGDGAGSILGCILCVTTGSVVSLPTITKNNAAAAPSVLQEPPLYDPSLLHRFIGCNLRAISFDTSIFLTNKKDFPVLCRAHQMLFVDALKRCGRTMRVMVEGKSKHHNMDDEFVNYSNGSSKGGGGRTGCLSYLEYLRHIRNRVEVTSTLDTEESIMEGSYLDHLQSPLQPLGDNLEFQIYETFEKDPVKYNNYRIAIELALRDGLALRQYNYIDNDDSVRVSFLVVGAGRGPLVRAALAAVKNVNNKRFVISSPDEKLLLSPKLVPEIIAVEKNPSAALYLSSLKLSGEVEWECVHVIQCDGRDLGLAASGLINKGERQGSRHLRHPALVRMAKSHHADLVVSELLGSFGDNELSPECINGVETSGLLRPDGKCVFIPKRYWSLLAPVSSSRLWAEAQTQSYMASNTLEGPCGRPNGALRSMETPYVVRPHAASQTHGEKICWQFEHPRHGPVENDVLRGQSNNDASCSNERYAKVVFPPDALQEGTESGCGYGRVKKNQFTSTSLSHNGKIIVHGFLGTFDCILYKSTVEHEGHETSAESRISIAPSNFSKGMFSWFPLYFPLREPLLVPPGASICCNMWRRTDAVSSSGSGGGRVWYEWCAEVVSTLEASESVSVLAASALHNPHGRSSFVRL